MSKRVFKKSSFSLSGKHCVGVSFDNNSIYVINTKQNNGPTIKFSKKEWQVFIKGVMNHEFDC